MLVLTIISLGVLYALPNVYPPDFALQISNEDTDLFVNDRILDRATARLNEAKIDYFGDRLDTGKAVIRFKNEDDRLKAVNIIELALHDDEGDSRYIVSMNAAATTPRWLRAIGGEPMKYGLDLRGGVHFLMEVDTESVIKERTTGLEQEIKRIFRSREDRVRYRYFERPETGALKIGFIDQELRDKARRKLQDRYPQYIIEALTGRPELIMRVDEASIREIEDFAIGQNIQSIRNRINELGVAEPLVQRLGRNRIVVDLPGVEDPAVAEIILGKVATLEFRMEAMPDAPRSRTTEYDYQGFPTRLENDIILRGDRVLDAQVGFDPESGLPQVNITLDGDGGELMHRSTRYNVGRRMAVIFIETKTRDRKVIEDGVEILVPERYVERRVISLATVQSALAVQFRITGLQAGEARDLALLLRAGALAADMFIAEERTVGASLGAENIELGATAVGVGLGLVLIFMLFYYKIFGIAANLALASNLVLLIAIMSSLGATLTLPGIAGIVLTVGMAVDANVLIFSRIKEELKNGLPPQQAINAGFERAFVTILDANITTLIVAVILYSIGTGPVKGFAVTLSIGIMTSMFTAIMGTRALVNFFYGGRNVKSIAI